MAYRRGMNTTATLYRWFITDDRGRRRPTRYLMSEADALVTDPTAERVPGSMEIRQRPVCTITCGAAHLAASGKVRNLAGDVA